MKRALKRSLAVVFCLGLSASLTVAQEDVKPPTKNVVGTQVKLRALDKVTATTKDFTLNVGDSLDYGSLRIDVKHCTKKPPEEIPATWAFLQVFDSNYEIEVEEDEEAPKIYEDEAGVRRVKAFSGWMMAERPAIAALEHKVYDVWVLDCF